MWPLREISFEQMLHIKPTVLLNDKSFGLFVAKFEATNDPKMNYFYYVLNRVHINYVYFKATKSKKKNRLPRDEKHR